MHSVPQAHDASHCRTCKDNAARERERESSILHAGQATYLGTVGTYVAHVGAAYLVRIFRVLGKAEPAFLFCHSPFINMNINMNIQIDIDTY